MNISGTILLYDSGDAIRCKIFDTTQKRNRIISEWESLYKISKKPNCYYVVVPDLDFHKRYKGYISLYSGQQFMDDSLYKSTLDRDDIINRWIISYDLESYDYTLNIIPNITDESD